MLLPQMNRNPTILVVEDDENAAALVTTVLQEGGFSVSLAGTAVSARQLLEKSAPKLVILDRTLPDGDGIDICAEIRSRPDLKATPILFLSARKGISEKVQGLNVGGDDYLAKPFSPAELLARVEALLRRSGLLSEPESLAAGKIRMDLRGRKAYLRDKPVELWAKEFDLLALLVSQRERVLTREFLLEHVWGYEAGNQPMTKVVDVTVSHLRNKLGAYGGRIASVRGFGYRFDPD